MTLQQRYEGQQDASRVFRQPGVTRVEFRVFRRQMFSDWETLCQEAADFANTLPSEALINISHSSGTGLGCDAVIVWYWHKDRLDREGGTQG